MTYRYGYAQVLGHERVEVDDEVRMFLKLELPSRDYIDKTGV